MNCHLRSFPLRFYQKNLDRYHHYLNSLMLLQEFHVVFQKRRIEPVERNYDTSLPAKTIHFAKREQTLIFHSHYCLPQPNIVVAQSQSAVSLRSVFDEVQILLAELKVSFSFP